LICAPAIYLPEVMVKRSDGQQGKALAPNPEMLNGTDS